MKQYNASFKKQDPAKWGSVLWTTQRHNVPFEEARPSFQNIQLSWNENASLSQGEFLHQKRSRCTLFTAFLLGNPILHAAAAASFKKLSFQEWRFATNCDPPLRQLSFQKCKIPFHKLQHFSNGFVTWQSCFFERSWKNIALCYYLITCFTHFGREKDTHWYRIFVSQRSCFKTSTADIKSLHFWVMFRRPTRILPSFRHPFKGNIAHNIVTAQFLHG
jgi:hypothetical protein